MSPALEVRDLVTRFDTHQGVVRAVNGVSWSVDEGQALAIVGESGSGKSVSALSVMGLIPSPPGRIESGEVLLHGRDLLGLPRVALDEIRGRDIAMVFQDPTTSLNPVLAVGRQIVETIELHTSATGAAARRQAMDLLNRVGIPDAEERMSVYPHQLSGGQRQRIMIAMALACRPSVLIADEPTTALDVTVQAQIVELIDELRTELGMAVVWITHDLALVAGFVDEVAVMYAGNVVERAPVEELYERPCHPYTVGLLRAMPRLDRPAGRRLHTIEGSPPDLIQRMRGCPFESRCPWVVEECRERQPELRGVTTGHLSACFRAEEVPALSSEDSL